jgi:hypothetical protein
MLLNVSMRITVTLIVAAAWLVSLASVQAQDEKPTKGEGTVQEKNPLDRFKDRDLRTLSEAERSELRKLFPVASGNPRISRPWYCWKDASTPGNPRFILFQGNKLVNIPGGSSAFVNVQTRSGVESFVFLTGWRIDLLSATWRQDPVLKRFIIDVCSSGGAENSGQNGRDISHQFYGLIGNKLALLRLEDSNGKLVANVYSAPNWTIGPAPPKRTAEEWEKALGSKDEFEVLEGLVWVSGEHFDDQSMRRADTYSEDPKSAALAAEVRKREGVKKAVEAFARSENVYIKEAAGIAARRLGGK